MNISLHKREQMKMIEEIYDSYINFSEYSVKRVEEHVQELFGDKYIKTPDEVLVYIPKNIIDKCTKVKVTKNNHVFFMDSDNNTLLSTYAQCVEDVVGLNNVKGFIIG